MSPELFSHLAGLLPEPMCLITGEGQIVSVNPAFAEAFQLNEQELIGTNLFGFITDDEAKMRRYLRDCSRSWSLSIGTLTLRLSAGEEITFRCEGALFHPSPEKQTSLVLLRLSHQANAVKKFTELNNRIEALNQEIRKRIQIEEQLGEQKEKLRVILTSIGDGVIATDRQGFVIFMNPIAETLTGFAEPEAIGKPLPDIFKVINEQTRQAVDNPVDKVIQTGYAVSFANHILLIARDGSEKAIDDSGAPIRSSDGNILGVVLVFRDVSEKRLVEKQLQEKEGQLLQSQKMEAIGQLAGGVAHDFNNLLTAIIGYVELSLFQLIPTDPIRQNLEEIKHAAERAASLTQQLLFFSRRQIAQPKPLDLNSVIENMHKMIRRLIGENIEIKIQLSDDLDLIFADTTQIEQILLNVTVNSKNAMPKGGELALETCNFHLDHFAHSRVGQVPPGDYVTLSIIDTGCGMDEETLKRIFEPFFTTREIGHGTGLGLATVYNIVKQGNGHIWVESEINRGTSFKIAFPKFESQEKELDTEGRPELIRGATETVLLIEDDQLVLQIARDILQFGGYKVLTSNSVVDAINICHNSKEKIHLLISDVVMPQAGVNQLTQLVKEVQPKCKILFMSGYDVEELANYGLQGGEIQFLQKPFTPDSLLKKVREVLGK